MIQALTLMFNFFHQLLHDTFAWWRRFDFVHFFCSSSTCRFPEVAGDTLYMYGSISHHRMVQRTQESRQAKQDISPQEQTLLAFGWKRMKTFVLMRVPGLCLWKWMISSQCRLLCSFIGHCSVKTTTKPPQWPGRCVWVSQHFASSWRKVVISRSKRLRWAPQHAKNRYSSMGVLHSRHPKIGCWYCLYSMHFTLSMHVQTRIWMISGEQM